MHFICFTDLKTYKYAPKRDVNHTFLVKSVIGAKFTTYASSQRREAVSAKWLRPNFKHTRDLVDVLNAQRSLFRARRDYSDALYAYVVNTLKLKQVAGTLSTADIDALSGWLDTAKEVQY